MKKTVAALALLLVIALLPPCLSAPAAAADGETVLYRQTTPSAMSAVKAAWQTNTIGWLRSCQVLGQGTLRQIDFFNNSYRESYGGGLPEGENLYIEFGVDIDPSGFAEVVLSLQYALCSANSDVRMDVPGRFELYTSCDGGATWSAEHAGLRSHRLVSVGTTSNNLEAEIYQLSTTDIACLLGADTHIDRIRIRPYGDLASHYGATRIHWIDVTGYAERQPEPAVPGSGAAVIPIPEETLRRIVVERMYDIIGVPWTTDTELITYNSNGYADEGHTQYYQPGRLYLGPSYQRPALATWEMVLSAIDGDGRYTGPTGVDKAWGMSCRTIVTAALNAVSNARHGPWAHLMFQPTLPMLGGVRDVSGTGDTRQIQRENDAAAVLLGYAQTHPGDFILHHNRTDSGSFSEHARLVTLEPEVVYEADGVTIDAAKSKLYLSETGGTILYYWQKPNGSVTSVSANTIRTSYGSAHEDPAAYQAAHPDYEFLYGTSCRKDKAYTFRELYDTYYIAYTAEPYLRGEVYAPETQADVLRGREDPKSEGLTVLISANWRLARLETALTDARTGEVLWQETRLPQADTFQTFLNSDELDGVLAGLGRGKYALTVDVTCGPITEVGGTIPVNRALDLAFTVGTPGDLTGDGKANGKDVTLLQRALAGGYGVTLDTAAADVSGDGKVNGKDVTLLQRFLAGGYGVTLQ